MKIGDMSRLTPPDAQDRSPLDDLSAIELEALRWSVKAGDALSPADRQALDAWLRDDPAHRRAFDDMSGVAQAIDDLPAVGKASISSSLAIDKAARSTAGHPEPAAARATRRRAAATLLVACTVACMVAVTVGGWLAWDHRQQRPVFARHYETARGQWLDTALPDGSRLQLDTATSAEVTLYRHRREVRLTEGQTVFHVQSDAQKPFDVLAGATRITVVGTRFAVRYAPSLGRPDVQVSVIEGRVRVASAGTGAMVTLGPGQMVTADAGGAFGRVSAVDPQLIAPWREKRLSFQDATLGAVVAELQRYGIERLRVGDAATAQLRITAGVDLDHVADFIKALPLVLRVRTEKRNGETLILSR